ncbi:MAG: DUF4340 domain-containing protein [Oligoflexia bacterium]|nr:DUF4340 domain-containing protein [Oligoflexia bacterium]
MTERKKKGFHGTVWLLVLTLAFGAYIFFIEIKKSEKDAKVKEEQEKLFSHTADTTTTIEIKNKLGSLKLEKDAKGIWQLTLPVKDLADEQVITTFLSSVSPEKFETVVSENQAEFNTFGITPDSNFIALTDKTGKRRQINVGTEAPISGKQYVKPEDENKVLLSNANLKFQSEKTVKEVRDKKIFRGNRSDVAQIVLTFSGKEKYEFIKDKDLWAVNITGKNEKADQDMVLKLLDSIEGLKAQEIIADSSDQNEYTKYNLKSGAFIEFLFNDKEGKLIEHIYIGKKDNMYARSDSRPVIYSVIPASVDPLLFKDPLLMRSLVFKDKIAPFEFKKEDVAEIVLKTSLAVIHLLKKGSNWEQAKPDDKFVVNQTQVTNFIDKVSQFKIGEFLNKEKPKGLTPPKGTITFKDSKGQIVLNVNWGELAKSQKTYFTKTSKSEELFGIDNSVIDTLPAQTLVESKEAAKKATTPEKAVPELPAGMPIEGIGGDHDGHSH